MSTDVAREPDVANKPSLPFASIAGEAGTRAELAREVVADDDDARFDLHLADRNIERADQAADVVETIGGVLQQQRVGAFVHRHRAALGQQAGRR